MYRQRHKQKSKHQNTHFKASYLNPAHPSQQAHWPKNITKIVHSIDTDSRIPVLPLLTGFKFGQYNTG